MSRVRKILKYGAFGVMALFGLLGATFVVGEAFDDPGGWRAVALSASWLVPLLALSALALLRPAAAGPVFVTATALVGSFTLADAAFGIIPRDSWGPVAAITVFALAVALAFLGLHRERLAGVLLVSVGLAQFVATLITNTLRTTGEGPDLNALAGSSSGVVVAPILVVGVLFLLAGPRHHDRSGRSTSLRRGGLG